MPLSRPYNIHYVLNDIEKTLITSIRQSTWLPLDEVWEMVLPTNPGISRSVVYRMDISVILTPCFGHIDPLQILFQRTDGN